jgi:phage recombination protein Bet
MSNVVPMSTPTPLRSRDYSPQQMALIRRTVAADTTADEFDIFVQIAQRAGLDPFRRQLYCVVYNKDDQKKRKVSFITGIDGFRAVAARNGDYRPDDAEPEFTIDELRKGPGNPQGLVKAVVKTFKRHGNEWHPVVGVAYWSEFAPMKDDVEGGFDWVDTGEKWPDTGKPKKRKVPRVEGAQAVQTPSGKWADMPFVMLAKCAEAQALRKGWPEDLSGIYSPEEMERPMLDVTPSEAVERHAVEQRMARIGGVHTIPVLWEAGQPIEAVPAGQFADRALAFLKGAESITQVEVWQDANAVGLKQFWAHQKADALELKKAIEARLAELAA